MKTCFIRRIQPLVLFFIQATCFSGPLQLWGYQYKVTKVFCISSPMMAIYLPKHVAMFE